MPTLAEIQAQSSAAFSALEQQYIADVCLETVASIATSLDGVTAEARQAIRADLAAYGAIGDGTEKLRGGSDGIDFDADRDREGIRRRIRRRLGLSPVKVDAGSGLDDPAALSWLALSIGNWMGSGSGEM
ncbi:MAG: hypothetical protein U0Z53_29055 [Blastocatellia bacterium]